MAKICRICMSATEDVIPLVQEEYVDEITEQSKLEEMFETCLMIKVNELNNYKCICMLCRIQLKYFYDFKILAIKTHQKLIKLNIENNENFQTENYIEIDKNNKIIEDENEKDNGNNDNDDEDDGIVTSTTNTLSIDDFINSNEHDNCEKINEENLENYENDNSNMIEEYLDDDEQQENDNGNFYEYSTINDNTNSEKELWDLQYEEIFEEEEINDENKEEYSVENLIDDIREIEESNFDNNSNEKTEKHYEIEVGNYESYEMNSSDTNSSGYLNLVEYDPDGDGKSSKRKTSKSSDDAGKSERKYHCDQCNLVFKRNHTFQAHLNIHSGLPAYSCHICKKGFKYKNNYEYHMKNHVNDRNFKCNLCDKSFLVRWDLRIHMRVHRNERPYECNKCGKGFRIRSHLKDHLETHIESKNYECPYCHQKFKTRTTLKTHKDTIHERTNRFECLQCGKTFNRNHHLKIHQKQHEDDKIVEIKNI